MASVRATVLENKLKIPLDSPVGRELSEKAKEGDEIDLKLSEWDYAWNDDYEGELEYSIRLEILHIWGEGGISSGIQLDELPWRIVGDFPMDLLTNPKEVDDHSRPYLSIGSPGYLSLEVEKLIKPNSSSNAELVFDDSNTLVPNEGNKQEPRKNVQNIEINDSVMNRSQVGASESSTEEFCPNCGEKIEDGGASFCMSCGAEI